MCAQAFGLPTNSAEEAEFVELVYFPIYGKKWKASTLGANRDRVNREIVGTFGDRQLRQIKRSELQDFLDSKAGMSFSTVDHLRWDLKQTFETAVGEGIAVKNPAVLLFTPKECPKPEHPTMSIEDVRLAFTVLPLRERLIVKLAIVAGMRPGEIFGLRRGRLSDTSADIQERVYRGGLDTPKTKPRVVALSSGVRQDLADWLAGSPDTGPDGWLFPSERLTTPLAKDNVMRRYIRPGLKEVGLGWVDFHVMRRTHSSLMEELGVSPKVISDQQGHGLGVHMDVYAQSSLQSRLEAVETLEAAL